MAMVTYPLNFIEYDAEDAETWLATRSSGVFAKNDFAASVTGADTNITIGTGLAWIHNHRFAGKAFKNDSDFILNLGVADSNFDRIDIVAIQFDKERNTTNIVVKHGTAQTNPPVPAISQTETLYELYLYSVSRPAGSLYVTSANVTDLRMSAYCGLMADSVTSVDTSAINSQVLALIDILNEKIEGVESGASIMLKTVYDADNDGVVDRAAMADSATTASTAATAETATKLATARTVRTNLASTSTASFDGSANITPGVTGTLPIANGGTGRTSAAAAVTALGAATAAQGTKADNAMPKSGGTFTGNAVAYSTNRTTSGLRNIEIRTTSATGTLQSTNKIIGVRK